jgi:hypothetical protein
MVAKRQYRVVLCYGMFFPFFLKKNLLALGLCIVSGMSFGQTERHPQRPKARLEVLATPTPVWFWRHSPRLTIAPDARLLAGGEVGIRWQTLGRHDWQVAHRFPALGVSLLGIDLGADKHGSAVVWLPHLSIAVVRRAAWSLNFRVGTGVARVTRPYDSFGYTRANALGSRWNNCTQFRLGGQVQVSPHWRLEAGGGLTHLSNGSYELPNFGLNLPGAYAMVIFSPKSLVFKDFDWRDISKKTTTRRLGGLVAGGWSPTEYLVLDGPKYAVWSVTAAATWRWHRFNRMALGADWERHSGVYAWGLHANEFADEAAARAGAQRWAVLLADEFFFGDLSIWLQTSMHVGPERFNRLVISQRYNKLTLRYYLPTWRDGAPRAFVGVHLKAYRSVAEYIGLQGGVAF